MGASLSGPTPLPADRRGVAAPTAVPLDDLSAPGKAAPMLTLALLAACSDPTPTRPAAGPAPAPVAAEAPTAEVAAATPAPSTSAFGLAIGAAGAPEIEAWLAARGLACPPVPSPRRTTVRYDCQGTLSPAALPERPTRGVLANILLVRGDDRPLQHWSAVRRYSLPADALADFTGTVASLEASHGAPERRRMPEAVEKLEAKTVHFDARWTFTDLEIGISLMRAGSPTWSVSETWVQPGAAAQDKPRDSGQGAPSHGGGKKPAWHP